MNYKIICEEIDSKYLSISALFENVNKNSQTIQLPAWRPGRYEIQIRVYGENCKMVQRFFEFEYNPSKLRKIDWMQIPSVLGTFKGIALRSSSIAI